ncbi:hypothetical protein CVR97_28625 [Salmonella enterica subsp. enterica serovar Typhimurium]|uniref:hypothetical protein n=1 Tax=Salmonella enterica TaxID=28901 RepID=UPI000C225949|nr:hypothetical protein [Salmonella enterica]PJH58654.1 hypothetical protein CVR97_28625 [Salmonella enterica subsp. enterica serovar Typhimurium]
MTTIEIPGALPTLNTVIEKNRYNKYAGNNLKQQATNCCKVHGIKAKNNGFQFKNRPADLNFTWYVKDRRKDPDNIASAAKFLLDGFVKAGLLENDGWKQIGAIHHYFEVDKANERVEIEEIERG